MTSKGVPNGEIEGLLEHGDWLRRLAWSLVHSSHDAQDLVQDTWIAAASAPRPEGVEARSWLAGITRNLARNFQRKEARRRVHEVARGGPAYGPGADEEVHELEQQRRLISALLAIPESQRRAVVARYYDGLAPRKIAARDGAPVATVKSQIQRGLGALRRELDESYGDRRTWSVALAPMASKVGSVGGVASGATAGAGYSWLGSKLLVAGLAVLVATSAIVYLALSRPTAEPQVDAMVPVEFLAGDANAANEGLTSLEEVAAVDAKPTNRLAASESSAGIADAAAATPGKRLRVLAKTRGAGLSVARFEGRVAFMRPIMEAAAERGEEIDSLDQVLAKGEPVEWNAEGEAWISNAPPVLVYAAAGDRAGIAMLDTSEPKARELVVELVDAPPLALRLVDGDGKLLEEDGLIQFEALLPKSGSGLLSAEGLLEGSADFGWQPQAATLKGGLGECRLVMNSANPAQLFEGLRTVQTRSFHLAAPGVAEFGGDAVSFGVTPLEPMSSGSREVTVLKPKLGALEVRVVDGAGRPVLMSGTASFQFQSVPSGMTTKSFDAALVDGVARWPRMHAGSHALDVTLSVPALGQTWTVKGNGPGTDGETALIETRAPEVTAVAARLVNEEGDPVANREVRLLHGERSFRRTLRFSSGPDGRVRFAIPEGGLKQGPMLLEIFDGRDVVGFGQVDMAAQVRSLGGDAGNWVVRFPEPVVVQGRLETPEGEPHKRAYVRLTRGGKASMRALVDTRGEFRFESVFSEEEILSIQLLRPDEKPFTVDLSRSPDKAVPVRPYELTEPVVVQLEEPQLGASVHARVDLTSFELEPEDVSLQISAKDPYRWKDLSWDATAQEYRALDVPEGTYAAYLRIRTSRPVASWERIEVGAGGAVRDPRLVSISLADYLRPVTVRWKDPIDPETGHPRPFLDTEFRESFRDPRRVEAPLITSGAAWPQLVPLDREGELHVNAPGYRTLRIPIGDLKEITEVELERGIEVEVTLKGTAPVGAKFGLYYVRDTPSGIRVLETHGPSLPVPRSLSGGDVWRARLPKVGRYQLWRHMGPPESSPVALRSWLTVEAPGAQTDRAQLLELDLGASASTTEEAVAK